MICVQVTLPFADPILEDRIEGALWEANVTSFERQDGETWSETVEDPRPLPPGAVRWRMFSPNDRTVQEAEAALRASLSQYEGLQWESWEITDLSFLTAWKEFFKPTQVSPRVMVNPPWEVPAQFSGVRVEIDPGMAFGTGTHETTRLCIRAIDRHVQQGDRVLDVGAGSGILAIAAAKLGGSYALAIDNDPVAVDVAREMIALNAATNVESFETPVEDVVGHWDMVLANILPHVLIEMKDALLAHTGRVLIMSGILNTESPKVEAAFADSGLKGPEYERMNEWCSMTYVRS